MSPSDLMFLGNYGFVLVQEDLNQKLHLRRGEKIRNRVLYWSFIGTFVVRKLKIVQLILLHFDIRNHVLPYLQNFFPPRSQLKTPHKWRKIHFRKHNPSLSLDFFS